MKLQSADIRTCWPQVRKGLEAVAAKVPVTWRPEDVYAEVVNGNAWLYTAPEGFIIFQPQREPYSGDRVLLVWIVWGEGVRLLEKYNDDVEALARFHGFDLITFWSPRRGLERVPQRLPGWEKQTVIFQRRLT